MRTNETTKTTTKTTTKISVRVDKEHEVYHGERTGAITYRVREIIGAGGCYANFNGSPLGRGATEAGAVADFVRRGRDAWIGDDQPLTVDRVDVGERRDNTDPPVPIPEADAVTEDGSYGRPRIYICGNSETLCSGSLQHTDELTAREMVDAATRVLDDAGIAADYVVDNAFRNWNGGSRRQFVGFSTGWIMSHGDEVDAGIKTACFEADSAMGEVLNDAERRELTDYRSAAERREDADDGKAAN